jgi:hypothetical protein
MPNTILNLLKKRKPLYSTIIFNKCILYNIQSIMNNKNMKVDSCSLHIKFSVKSKRYSISHNKVSIILIENDQLTDYI